MNEIGDQACDAGEWFPLEVVFRDRATDAPLDLAAVAVSAYVQRRRGEGDEAAPVAFDVTDWVLGEVDGVGAIRRGTLWFSPADLATAGTYDITVTATASPLVKPWPQRASFRLEVRPAVT